MPLVVQNSSIQDIFTPLKCLIKAVDATTDDSLYKRLESLLLDTALKDCSEYIDKEITTHNNLSSQLKEIADHVQICYSEALHALPEFIANEFKISLLCRKISDVFIANYYTQQNRCKDIQLPYHLSAKIISSSIKYHGITLAKIFESLNENFPLSRLEELCLESFTDKFKSRILQLTKAEVNLYRNKLEEGISVDNQLIHSIKQHFTNNNNKIKSQPSYISRNCSLVAGSSNEVWTMDSYPNLIFKSQRLMKVPTEKRFVEMILARKVCDLCCFDRLILPQATLIKVPLDQSRVAYIIAEEKLPISKSIDKQKDIWFHHAKSLECAASQLFQMGQMTGLTDIHYRNFPVVEDNCYNKIGLVDIERISDEKNILKTADIQYLLMNGESAEKILNSVSIDPRIMKSMIAEVYRRENNYRELLEFYESQGITKGNELIEIDTDTIDCSGLADNIDQLGEEGYKKVKECINKIVNDLNVSITRDFQPNRPIAANRYISINFSSFAEELEAYGKEDLSTYKSEEEVKDAVEQTLYRFYYQNPMPEGKYFFDDEELSYAEAAIQILIKEKAIYRQVGTYSTWHKLQA